MLESETLTVKQQVFSLIELLIVVAIILVISAIAIPNYLRSRMQANEASAVGSSYDRHFGRELFHHLMSTSGSRRNLADLGGANPRTATSTTACILENTIAMGTKSGYSFLRTGDRTDEAGAIRYDPSGAGCDAASSPVQ
ncbi:MAG TPA: prepilin-type N-terminal cleavage/methylation domain-containing protein [Candidatus Acidoferrum sp.]